MDEKERRISAYLQNIFTWFISFKVNLKFFLENLENVEIKKEGEIIKFSASN